MTTSFRNFIGPLRVEFLRNILKKGPKISETGAENYLSEKTFLRLGALELLVLHLTLMKELGSENVSYNYLY